MNATTNREKSIFRDELTIIIQIIVVENVTIYQILSNLVQVELDRVKNRNVNIYK